MALSLAVASANLSDAPDKGGYLALVGVVSFAIAFSCCYVLSTVVESAVKAAFVCFGECPVRLLYNLMIPFFSSNSHFSRLSFPQEGLRLTHPISFGVLLNGWAQSYPQEIEASGYTEKYANYLTVRAN